MAQTINMDDGDVTDSITTRNEKKKKKEKESLIERLKRQKNEKQKLIDSL
jgi:hypothetical protein